MTPEPEKKPTPEQLIQELCRRDPRYPFKAYEFILDAIGYVQHQVKRSEHQEGDSKHVTGQQLAAGCRDFALQEYGMMAGTVLQTWNIKETADLGELVYNLIGIQLMTKTETDRKEDFHNVFDMQKSFAEGFQFQFV